MNINTVFLFISAVFVGSFGVPTSQPHPELVHLGDSDLGNSDLGIIGGDVAAEGSAPYMVALTLIFNETVIGTLRCGGSLITTRTVLTAGQCVPPYEVFLRHYYGTVGTNSWKSGGQRYAFERGIIHEKYNVGGHLRNDIGLLITVTKVVLSKLVQPVSLHFDNVPGGKRSIVTGWGRIKKENPEMSDTLMEVYMKTVDGETCAKQMKDIENGALKCELDPNSQLCAYNSTGHGICYGDPGSALVLLDESGAPKAQIGIASFACPSCAKGNPDGFTKVSHYQDWLKKNVVE